MTAQLETYDFHGIVMEFPCQCPDLNPSEMPPSRDTLKKISEVFIISLYHALRQLLGEFFFCKCPESKPTAPLKHYFSGIPPFDS